MTSDPKKLLLIVNPASGRRRTLPLISDITRIFSENGYDTELFLTKARGDAADIACKRADEFSRIVCAGGDGTLNEVISGILSSGKHVKLGYIPAGTTNDFANTLGLSHDILTAAHDSVGDNLRSIDVGTFNGRAFVYIASFGAFTRASYTTPQAAKNVLGHFAYILGGIHEIGSLKSWDVTFTTADGETRSGSFIFGSVSNSRDVAGIVHLRDESVSLNDGQFEAMLVSPPSSPSQLLHLVSAVLKGEPDSSPLVNFFKVSSLSFSCASGTAWTVDGEDAGESEQIAIRVIPHAITLAIPEGKDM